jgi:di/tricarboxylate transporter
VATLGLNRLYGVKVMGVQRHGLQHRYHLRGMRLKGGDVLLLQADRRGVDALRETGAVMVVEQIRHLTVQRARAPFAIAILVAIVVVAGLNLVPLQLVSVLAVGALMVTRCLLPREAIAALDAPVLLLIASSIPLGLAMERCGLADTVAHGIVTALGGLGPVAVLSGFYLATSVLTALLSNNATAVLMTPLALGTATALGVDPKPFLLAVMFGASACFVTPIGYQTNLIVMGPGGYTFGDFFRFGLPLNVLLWLMATVLIPLFWPLG